MVSAWRLGKFILKLDKHKLVTPLFLLTCIFLLAGGLGAFSSYSAGAVDVESYLNAVTFPFIVGFLFVGFLGLRYALANRDSKVCLFGFLIVLICYGCIEYFYRLIGGS